MSLKLCPDCTVTGYVLNRALCGLFPLGRGHSAFPLMQGQVLSASVDVHHSSCPPTPSVVPGFTLASRVHVKGIHSLNRHETPSRATCVGNAFLPLSGLRTQRAGGEGSENRCCTSLWACGAGGTGTPEHTQCAHRRARPYHARASLNFPFLLQL